MLGFQSAAARFQHISQLVWAYRKLVHGSGEQPHPMFVNVLHGELMELIMTCMVSVMPQLRTRNQSTWEATHMCGLDVKPQLEDKYVKARMRAMLLCTVSASSRQQHK